MNNVKMSGVSRSSQRDSAAGTRRGAMLVFVAIAMVTLLGFLAMTLDVGSGNRQRRIEQTAADAAALGGAVEIYKLSTDGNVIRAAAKNIALRNGFPADDVTVTYPPASGAYAGNNQYVEVVVNKNIQTIFGSIFSYSSLAVGARAVAGVGSFSLICLYSLDPNGSKAIEIEIGGEVDTNCGIAINSTNPNALDTNSSGLLSTDGSPIAVSGGYTGGKTPIPAPSTGSTQVVDPLSYVTMPAVGACNHTGLLTKSKDTVLTPGVYCGGINIDSKTTTLSAGTYIMAGGGFTVGKSGVVIGVGVTIITTPDPAGVYSFGGFDFSTGCKATLSAPTADPFKGILWYADPAGPTNYENIYACSNGDPLVGALYLPTQKLTFQGSNTTTEVDGAVIAKNIDVKGKLVINSDTSGNSATKRLSLVE
jgi:hypothetical protein